MSAGRADNPSELVIVGIPVRHIQRVLAGVVIGLFVLSTIGRVLKFAVYWDYAYSFVETFWLDAEFGVPRVFATGLLVLVAFTAAANAVIARNRSDLAWKPWLAIAAIFALASVEKIAGLHDRYGDRAYGFIEETGPAKIAALLAATVLLAGVAVWLGRFTVALPRVVRSKILLACAVFVIASVGLELLGSEVENVNDTPAIIRYFVCASLEETLEMIGTLVFLDAFLIVLGK